jgi:hypothetical protein
MMDFIRVSDDHWNFETLNSAERFVPFGANFIFYDPGHPMKWSLNILTREVWQPDTIRQVFYSARDLGMNLMKVFLPTPDVLPDPQTNDALRLPDLHPPLFERLEFVFDLARETGVYISLCLSEWGMSGAAWFHEGGAFMGCEAAGDTGVNSYAVYRNFWQAVGEHCRHEPALFSYNLAVELYVPDGNWGAGASASEENTSLHYHARWGDPAWQQWALRAHGSLDGMNRAWGTAYRRMDEVQQPEIKWQPERGAYSQPQALVADYINFKECVTYAFLKNQADAIRSRDPHHMITCGLHPDQSGLAPMGWGWKTCGITHCELDFLDYLTPHLYTHIDYLITRVWQLDDSPGRPPDVLERRRHEALLYARFMAADKPLLMEEMGHAVSDPQESLRGTMELAEAMSEHVSGLQIWFLSDVPKNNTEWHFGPLGVDLRPNAWGAQWCKLIEAGGLMTRYPPRRAPARTVIALERLEGLAPTRETAGEKIIKAWDHYEHPIDFVWPRNPYIVR